MEIRGEGGWKGRTTRNEDTEADMVIRETGWKGEDIYRNEATEEEMQMRRREGGEREDNEE